MKRIVGILMLLLCVWSLPKHCSAQITYELEIDSIVGFPDTIVNGTSVTFYMDVSNNSNLFYQGNIYVELEYAGSFFVADTTMASSPALSPVAPISLQVTHRFTTDDGLSIGDNVVVVWPRLGDGTNPNQEVLNPFTKIITLIEPNGIRHQENARTHRAFIFPNPANRQVSFNLNAEDQVSNVAVYDISGRVMMHTASINKLEVSHFQKGIYLVEVRTKKGNTYFDRMVIQH